MTICDAHCHFFSASLFRVFGRDVQAPGDAAETLPARLNFDPPGDDVALADRWMAELDRHAVQRAMLIASVPGDEASVAAAVKRHPTRFVGAFMLHPGAPDAATRLEHAFGRLGLRTICLFPAMHHVALDDERVDAVFAAAARHGAAVFVHCGVLSVGIRQRLNLAARIDIRLGDPLAVAAVAARHPSVPVIIPHFGAGPFQEALMAAATAPNIVFDSSSSNSWTKFHPGLTLEGVFARALDVAGPSRVMFGTDSSFFPRGWQKPIYEAQLAALTSLGVSSADQQKVFGGNFDRMFA